MSSTPVRHAAFCLVGLILFSVKTKQKYGFFYFLCFEVIGVKTLMWTEFRWRGRDAQ